MYDEWSGIAKYGQYEVKELCTFLRQRNQTNKSTSEQNSAEWIGKLICSDEEQQGDWYSSNTYCVVAAMYTMFFSDRAMLDCIQLGNPCLF